MLRIIRGLPGSGKSTFARRYGCFHVEADMYHYNEDIYHWRPNNVKDAHEWCWNVTYDAMARGMDVAVSNTFTTMKELRPYLELPALVEMEQKIAKPGLMVYKCTGNYRNIHNVSATVIQKMADRWEDYEGEIKV